MASQAWCGGGYFQKEKGGRTIRSQSQPWSQTTVSSGQAVKEREGDPLGARRGPTSAGLERDGEGTGEADGKTGRAQRRRDHRSVRRELDLEWEDGKEEK